MGCIVTDGWHVKKKKKEIVNDVLFFAVPLDLSREIDFCQFLDYYFYLK